MSDSRQTSVWDHYIDYLAEATQIDRDRIKKIVSPIKNSISEGCTLQELRILMLRVFEPITIMQALEQWQNQMDIMLHTGLKKFNGETRYEHYAEKKDESPYDFGADGILDDHRASAHIYDLSGMTQTIMHMSYEHGGKQAPEWIENAQKEAELKDNFEINMLLGDCYRNIGNFKKAIQTYEELWEKNGHRDSSIQDAIIFTKFAMKQGEELKGKHIDEWLDDYHDFKKQETVRRTSPKISRNAPCPCGSGKKYKLCCGRNG